MKKFLSSLVFWTKETFKTFSNFLFYVSVAGLIVIGGAVILMEQIDTQTTLSEVTLDGNTN